MNCVIQFACATCTLWLLTTPTAHAADHSYATTRVLFLGDKGHHRPAAFNAILQPALAKHDIEMVYTQDMNDLNSTNLARFDCLMLYANITRIPADQEMALLDFVSAGGGFAPIHCASFCFQNSTNCIALIGGQFQKHQTGVFKETITKSDHPVMKGLTAIESWDETYVHTKHNTNRIVLAERRYAGTNSMAANLGNTDKPGGAEPYTWVREQGRGRVFYTAWGHDQRTWTNANFQALVENGIRWAAENSPNLKKPRTSWKPPEFLPNEAIVPNHANRTGDDQEQFQTRLAPFTLANSTQRLFTQSDFDRRTLLFKPFWLHRDKRREALGL